MAVLQATAPEALDCGAALDTAAFAAFVPAVRAMNSAGVTTMIDGGARVDDDLPVTPTPDLRLISCDDIIVDILIGNVPATFSTRCGR